MLLLIVEFFVTAAILIRELVSMQARDELTTLRRRFVP